MRVLYLLRHARPVSPDGTRDDFDRPLTPEGRVEATKVSNTLLVERLSNPCVLSSPATRARETTEIVISTNGWSSNFESRIYEAKLETLIKLIDEIDDACKVVILVGHNPGMESLLRCFTGELRAMPTAGLAKIVLEIDSWREGANANARLEWIVSP